MGQTRVQNAYIDNNTIIIYTDTEIYNMLKNETTGCVINKVSLQLQNMYLHDHTILKHVVISIK